MAVVAYARVSKDDQNLELQRYALEQAGYDQLFEDDGVSAVAEKRDGFAAALAALQPGDTFLVWKNDRAFRMLKEAVLTMEYFLSIDVTFRSLTEFIETSTPMGRAMFYIINVFAQLERETIVERTKAGIAAAKRKGKFPGRRPKLTDEHIAFARESLQAGEALVRIADALLVSSRTLSRALGGR